MNAYTETSGPESGPLHRIWSLLVWRLESFVMEVLGSQVLVTAGGRLHTFPRALPEARAYIHRTWSSGDQPYRRTEETLAALTGEWQTTREVAARLSITRAAAFERLKRLLAHGEIERSSLPHPTHFGSVPARWRLAQETP